MLETDCPPTTTSNPAQTQHLVLSIEALCEYMANFIYSFEELRFDANHFFSTVVTLLNEGDSVETTLTLSEVIGQICSEASVHEMDEATTYAHLLEKAVDDIAEQLYRLNLTEREIANLQFSGMRHQKLFLAKTFDYEYE